MKDVGSPDLTITDSDSDSVYQIYDISTMTSQMIGSVKVALIPSRNVSETKATVQDVPQAKTFQSKVCHPIMSPEELSDQCQIGLEEARDKINKTSQILSRSAVMTLVRQYKAERVFQTNSLTYIWATDTMDERIKSLDGNRYAQVFSNGKYLLKCI